MGFLEVFKLQFNSACGTDYRFSQGRGQHFLLLHHASTDMIETPSGALFVQRIRDKGQDHTVSKEVFVGCGGSSREFLGPMGIL
jgi:hypothetical protein